MNNLKISNQILAQLTVGLNELASGIGDGWQSPLVTNNTHPYHDDIFLTLDEHSLINWIEIAGVLVGAIIAAILLDKVGRKCLLTICAIAFCLPWVAIIFANSGFIFALRGIAFGIAYGINESANCAYFGETCSPSNRVRFGTFCISFYYLGVLVGYIPSKFFNFRLAATFNFFITMLSVISAYWMVEPVQYLLMKGKQAQAQENFAWLNDIKDPNELAAEFDKIKQNVCVETSKKSSWVEIFTSLTSHKSLLIMFTIYSLIGVTDNEHAPRVFENYYGISNIYDSDTFLISIWAAQFLIAASSSFVIDRFNQRLVILTSISLLSLIYGVFAIVFLMEQLVVFSDNLRITFTYIREIFFTCITALFYPTLFVLRSELFPLSVRGFGNGMSIVLNLGSFLIMEFIMQLLRFNYFISFVLFSIFNAVLVLFVHRKLPETEGKSLIEIQEILENENYGKL